MDFSIILYILSSLYVCMAIKYIIVLFVETPRKFITAKLSIRKPGSSSDNNNIICTFSLYIELTLINITIQLRCDSG